jgi:hypothetical protein
MKTVDAKLLGTEKHLSSSKQKLKSMSTQFKLTEISDNHIKVEINGTAKDLTLLLANAIQSNDRIREVVAMALAMTEFENQFKAQLN